MRQSHMGAPYDPDPDDELQDDQASLNDDYLQDAVDDVQRSWPDDNPQDAPAGGREELREAVKDDMPGPDTEDAINRDLHSPNERTGDSQFNERYFDVADNPELGTKAQNGQSVEEALDKEEDAVDRTAPDDPDIAGRIG